MNLDVLARFCTPARKDRWLPDLLEGKIRSAYLMTELHVASPVAANIALIAEKTAIGWQLNGEKWWDRGAHQVALKVVDEVTQMFGAMGISQDTP